jgi:energy-coupling factor transport system ATP-binding protein
VGPNGSGKSSLTSILAGLVVPTHGSCLLDGTPVADQPDRVALVIQNTRLQLMRPTVAEELSDLASDPGRVPPVVRRLHLAPLLSRRIDELSGGQQRRVGLAGAMARHADLIIMDEPMAGLDRQARSQLLEALASVPDESIVVVVTHDLEACRPILGHGRTGRLLRIDGGRVKETTSS